MARADAQSADELAAELARQLEAVVSSERELRGLLAEAHEQVSEREESLRQLLAELEATRAERESAIEELGRAHAELAAMRRTRLWRTGALFWWLRDQLRGRRAG